MGASPVAVRFHDGAIARGVFNSTCDLVCVGLRWDRFPTRLEARRYMDEDKCRRARHSGEPVEFSMYKDGTWRGTACRECMIVLDGFDPFDDPVTSATRSRGDPPWAKWSGQYGGWAW